MNNKTEKLILKVAKSIIKDTVKRNITESHIMLSQCIRLYLGLVLNKDSYSITMEPPRGLASHRLNVVFQVHNGAHELKMKI